MRKPPTQIPNVNLHQVVQTILELIEKYDPKYHDMLMDALERLYQKVIRRVTGDGHRGRPQGRAKGGMHWGDRDYRGGTTCGGQGGS